MCKEGKMIKIENIQEGSLWYEVGGKTFLWRLRFYNPNTKSEDKVSIVFEEMSKVLIHRLKELN